MLSSTYEEGTIVLYRRHQRMTLTEKFCKGNSYTCACVMLKVLNCGSKHTFHTRQLFLVTNEFFYKKRCLAHVWLLSTIEHWESPVMQRTTWERPESLSVEQSKNLDKDLAHLLHEAKASPEDNSAVQDDADKAIDQISKVSWITLMIQEFYH